MIQEEYQDAIAEAYFNATREIVNVFDSLNKEDQERLLTELRTRVKNE